MTPAQLTALLDRLDCALADVPRRRRAAVDEAVTELTAAYLQRVAECERLRRLQSRWGYRRLFARIQEVHAC